VAVVTYRHTVGENGLGLNRPRHYQIVEEMLHQHGRGSIVELTAGQI